jgi:hypothetical protein
LARSDNFPLPTLRQRWRCGAPALPFRIPQSAMACAALHLDLFEQPAQRLAHQ